MQGSPVDPRFELALAAMSMQVPPMTDLHPFMAQPGCNTCICGQRRDGPLHAIKGKRAPDPRTVLAAIRVDVENDVAGMDGLPFDGKTVARLLGQVYAMVDALAAILDQHLADHEAAADVRRWGAEA